MDPSLGTTRNIEQDLVVYILILSEVFPSIHLDSLDIGRSLETSIVHELVITDLILLYGGDLACIFY